jgi:Ni/Co efflux regulator RcnB
MAAAALSLIVAAPIAAAQPTGTQGDQAAPGPGGRHGGGQGGQKGPRGAQGQGGGGAAAGQGSGGKGAGGKGQDGQAQGGQGRQRGGGQGDRGQGRRRGQDGQRGQGGSGNAVEGIFKLFGSIIGSPHRDEQSGGGRRNGQGGGDGGDGGDQGKHSREGDRGGDGDRGDQGGSNRGDDRGGYGERVGGGARGPTHARIRAERYRYPQDVSYRFYRRGERLAPSLMVDDYLIDDFVAAGLMEPPHGDRWMRFGPDALLIDPQSGQVLDVIYGVFDDGAYTPPPPDDLAADATRPTEDFSREDQRRFEPPAPDQDEARGPPPPPPETAGPDSIPSAGQAGLPHRPFLRTPPPVQPPASFCSAAERNRFYDEVYKPAQDIAAENNDKAKRYLDALNSLHAQYMSSSLDRANAVTYEAVAYQPIAQAAFRTSNDYAAMFDTIMAIPIEPCR